MVREGNNLTLYINGAFSASGTTTWTSTYTRNLQIGKKSEHGDDHWGGKLDQIRIYNRALAQTDVSSLYRSEAVPPSLTTQPVSQTVSVGSNATFSVAATGTAPLSYQWRKDGNNLIGATNPTLSFTATNRSFMGAYSVLVTNLSGSVTSSPAGLRVMVPQRLLPPERQSDGRFNLRFGDYDGGLAGASDLSAFEVYATTNLLNTNSWVLLTNVVSIVNGQVQIEDKDTQGLPRRFYRIIER